MNVLGLDCSADTLCAAVRRSGSPTGGPSGDGSAASGKPGIPKHPFREPRGHETRDGTIVLEIDAGLRHAQRILPAVDLCLREAGLELRDLDLLACAAGPGSFTGLRIALSTVKGLSSALGIPFVTVPTPDCLAAEWEGACPVVIPVLDAQRGRFYAAVYERGRRTSGYLDLPLTELLRYADAFPEVLFTGPAADLLVGSEEGRPGLRIVRYGRGSPARGLLDLAVERFRSEGPADPECGPLYVRKSDAETEQRRD